jgi:hypothetical protein
MCMLRRDLVVFHDLGVHALGQPHMAQIAASGPPELVSCLMWSLLRDPEPGPGTFQLCPSLRGQGLALRGGKIPKWSKKWVFLLLPRRGRGTEFDMAVWV